MLTGLNPTRVAIYGTTGRYSHHTVNLPAVSAAVATVAVSVRATVVLTGAVVAVSVPRFAVAVDHGDPEIAAALMMSFADSALTAIVAEPPDVGTVSTRTPLSTMI